MNAWAGAWPGDVADAADARLSASAAEDRILFRGSFVL